MFRIDVLTVRKIPYSQCIRQILWTKIALALAF